jgi:hypothetical protein
MRNQKTPNSTQRTLRGFESLESRAMMAGDVACFHNIQLPEDTDGSGDVTPLDALVVINRINNPTAVTNASANDTLPDVDGDSVMTPLDALAVINHLNRNAGSSKVLPSSDVSSTERIARIESLISQGKLAARFSLTDAMDVIATLRSGGHPEAGDHIEGVELKSGSEDSNAFISRLTAKLTAANVRPETITIITTEITDAKTAGQPLTFTQIKARLTDLGVDIAKLFPAVETEDSKFLTSLTARLTKAGVTTQVIETITTEITAAVKTGTPLTLIQIKTRLTDLGVDVTKFFPARPTEVDELLANLRARLAKAGVTTEVITTITTEIATADKAGTPLTLAQIKVRLTELGVDLTKVFPVKVEGDRFLDFLRSRLVKAGVTAEVIKTIFNEIVTAKTAGAPLTLLQIRTRLTELGVDVSKLFRK